MSKPAKFADVEKILDSDEPAPNPIYKDDRFWLLGNSRSVFAVVADRHGRLWREEEDRLVRIVGVGLHAVE